MTREYFGNQWIERPDDYDRAGIPARIANALRHQRLTLEEAISWPDQQLLTIENLGKKGIITFRALTQGGE